MNRLYTAFMLLIAAILLLIFHSSELGSFWNTEIQTTGSYYRETFFRKARMNPPSQLAELNGRLLESGPHRVVYQFANPLNADLYIRPALVKQSDLLDHKQKLFSYKNLKSLRLRFPSQTGQSGEKQLFHVADQTSKRIHLNPYLKDAPLFQLILDNSGTYAHSERVIGSLEIYLVEKPINTAIPLLPIFVLFLIAPVIWSWTLNQGLGFSLASSLGIASTALLVSHILWIFQPDLTQLLLPTGILICLLLLALRSWFEHRPLPTRPFFWGLIWLATQIRWQEILIQATQPLNELPLAQQYYQQAIFMDLFTDKGFFSALQPQSPLYPFLIKLSGYVFGFSPLHLFYVSLLGGLLFLALSYRLAVQLLNSRPKALLILGILSLNHLLIREAGLFSPDIFSATLLLAYLLLMFAPLKSSLLRGLLRGGILVLQIWTHLSFFPLACLVLLLDMAYQVHRSRPTTDWKKSLLCTLLSALMLLGGFLPLVQHNWQHYRSYFPETTAYISRVANLEFSDQQGFPASLDVVMRGDKAPHYRKLGIREYFWSKHHWSEWLGASGLGFLMISLDSIGALLNVTTGENILGVLIHGLSSHQNLLPLLILFLLEIFMALLLVVFAWVRFIRYRVLLLMLLLLILPHCFFYGIFMLKGFSLLQNLLDHQVLLICLPILSLLSVDALFWLQREHWRWLR